MYPYVVFYLWLALCVILFLLLSGCGSRSNENAEEEVQYVGLSGKELVTTSAEDHVFSLNYDPYGGFNPFTTSSGTNMHFLPLLYDSLFEVESDYSWSTEIVEDISTDDYLWWTFTIRSDIQFTDGTLLTAQDVAYSLQRAQQSPNYSARLTSVYGISTLDNTQFALSANVANSMLPVLLNIPIVKYGTGNDDVPVGSGMYQLARGQNKLDLFSGNRHAGEAPIQEIWLKNYEDIAERISAFEISLLDVTVNDPSGAFSIGYGGSNETRTFDTNNLHFIGFNMNSSVFQHPEARKALHYAFDREEVVDQYLNGVGTPTPLACQPASMLYDAALAGSLKYDLDECARLFLEAGVDDLDDDGELEILYYGYEMNVSLDFIVNSDSNVKIQTARRIAENLNSIGIRTNLHELSWDDYMYRLNSGTYDLYYGEIRITSDWDISPLFSSSSNLNYGHCTDSTYLEKFRAYLAADESDRAGLFSDVCEYVVERGGIVPICFEKQQMITHRGVVSGAAPTQYNLFHRFYEWKINVS